MTAENSKPLSNEEPGSSKGKTSRREASRQKASGNSITGNGGGVSSSPVQVGTIQKRTVAALTEFLADSPSAKKKNSKKDDSARKALEELAHSLFSHAPTDFLSSRSLSDLFEITELVQAELSTFFSSENRYCVTVSESTAPNAEEEEGSPHSIRVTTVLGDRPFIINSMRECIIQSGGVIEVFLHPILLRDGQRFSCCYLEITGINGESAKVLKKNLERAFEHVISSTDDFTGMLVRVETLARVIESDRPSSFFPARDKKETAHFLRWLTDGGFLFTGLTTWQPQKVGELPSTPQSALGVHRLESRFGESLRDELLEDLRQHNENEEILTVSRLRAESLVQRRSQLLNFTLLEPSPDGSLYTCYQITGLLTSKALSEESSSVPILRRKLKELLDREGALEQSHNHKNIVNIFNSMPKEEAFLLDLDSLQSIVHTILDIQNKNETRVSVRYGAGNRSASVLTVMPRDRFNTDVRHRIQNYVEKVFRAVPGSSEYFLDLSNKPHARFYFHIPLPKEGVLDVNLAKLKVDIAELTRGWKDNLEERILKSDIFSQPKEIWKTYGDAFDEQYQALQSIDDCEHDIAMMEQLDGTGSLKISMRPSDGDLPGCFNLVAYKRGEVLTISYAFPILENAGLEVLTERDFQVTPLRREKVSIHRFLVRTKAGAYLSQEAFDSILAPGLEQIFSGAAKDDLLNSLLISSGLEISSIFLLRSYCSLLWQANKFASKSAILKALTSVPTAASQLWNMFEIRFNPDSDSTIESRQQRFQTTLSTFRDSLRDVKDITNDRILRALANLLEHTTRTNFYQRRNTIALKIHSEEVDFMPHPRPKFEIYVRGQNLEGVHLRAGHVARGGLRWSDRHQDFRQEILDLVKTQNVKNALIVPVGSKGGFVVKGLPENSGDQRLAVESAYKDFIRSLLSVTDNRKGEKILRPEKVIAYDGDDPYLVVAADKGTATFSDIANGIAVDEFNFWLGDAFASGGSVGYDHKLYGITARGAWESVKRHFTNLGIDYTTDPFTVVGIGDMSGDVFGNGLIESDKIKLLAAFNHVHIFLDPDPDPTSSFQERKRLFALGRSSWTDYNSDLISEGGGIFERAAREIQVPSQVRLALGMPEDAPETISGEQLISYILKAPVDLLWNGGIGTYVKAKQESHADVNDGTNDRVRVNAAELRCRVIGEGGNLGLTQKARIEFSKLGGHMNTDAIDNSGGVDLSDHEVNLKILFQSLMAKKKMTLEERNRLLPELAEEVVHDVLRHNFNHALALTIGVERSRKSIDYFKSLLREMSKIRIVNRQIDYLPDDEELIERSRKKQGLWKPELAVCLAAVKRWVKRDLEASRLTQDPLLQTFLLEYFPKPLREKYKKEICAHPLADNIISTQVTNELIDSLGVTFVHRMCVTYSTSPLNVMKSTLAADMLMHARSLREEVRYLETSRVPSSDPAKALLLLLQELHEALRDLAAWFIAYHPTETLADSVNLYQEGFQKLMTRQTEFCTDRQQELFELRLGKYASFGLSENASRSFASFSNASIFMEILWSAKQLQLEALPVAKSFMTILESLMLDDIVIVGSSMEPKSKWEAELTMGALRDVRRAVSLLTCSLHDNGISDPLAVQALLEESHAVSDIRSLIEELKGGDPSIVKIAVLSRHLLDLHKHIT
ncbi:MAG: NAD-glutamate dehydrogenase [Bdellovibrionales bacterium]|nr:NAD-glutamate dehydrogenase [Bdellovibrionales bacterium]